MAFDAPEAVSRLAVLDILPTWNYWERLDRANGLGIYHWMFLAQPHPFPETLIGGASGYFLEHTLTGWTAAKDLSAFERRALLAYYAQMADPARLNAMCEDYRAGATVDVADDAADRAAGRRIAAPLLVLWGSTGIAKGKRSPVEVWQKWPRTCGAKPSTAAISCRKRRPTPRLPRSCPS